jgi:hypothetical protein
LKTISDINETVDKFSEKKIADTVMTLVKTNTELGNLKTDFIDLTDKSEGRLFYYSRNGKKKSVSFLHLIVFLITHSV